VNCWILVVLIFCLINVVCVVVMLVMMICVCVELSGVLVRLVFSVIE